MANLGVPHYASDAVALKSDGMTWQNRMYGTITRSIQNTTKISDTSHTTGKSALTAAGNTWIV
jgi:hypothetical protein